MTMGSRRGQAREGVRGKKGLEPSIYTNLD
jgi:hypothetical protein